MIKFDIVIPTKNEEKNIELLIKDIKAQSLQPDKIIIADKSKDNTASVAKKLGAIIAKGVDDGYIGKARNNGIKSSTSPYVIFLDADVRIYDKDYFKKILSEFVSKDLDIATTYVALHDGNIVSPFFSGIYNLVKIIGAKTKNVLSDSGTCMIAKVKSFNEIGGFDESLKNNEDIELLHRFLKAKMKFDVIKLPIYTSARRFKNRGMFGVLALIIAAIGITVIVKLKIKNVQKVQTKLEGIYGELGGKAPKSK